MPNEILLTGFGPFPDVERNVSLTVATRLHGLRCGAYRTRALELPTSFREAPALLRRHWVELNPVALVHLGVATQSTGVRIESQATNRVAAKVDARGYKPMEGPIDPTEAPDFVLRCPLDAQAIAARLQSAGLECEASDNAGDYVCNFLYFASLSRRLSDAQPKPVLFIHLPPEGAARASGGHWDLPALSTAVRLAIGELVAQALPESAA